MKTQVEKLIADTLVVFDRLTYYRDRESTNSIFEEYELVDISTCNFLSNEKSYFQIIHFYKSDNGVTQIRAGDKMTNYADVSLFLMEGHSLPEILIFLGKGINLEDKNYIQLKTKLSEKRRANPLILTEIE